MTREHYEIRDRFIEDNENKMNELNYFTVYTEINDIMFKQISEIKDRIYLKAKEKKRFKPEDQILRKCPYCKEVWVKVSGCDGGTICGEREPTSDSQIAEQKKNMWGGHFRYWITFAWIGSKDDDDTNYDISENN